MSISLVVRQSFAGYSPGELLSDPDVVQIVLSGSYASYVTPIELPDITPVVPPEPAAPVAPETNEGNT